MTDGRANPIPHRQISPGIQFLIVVGLLLLTLIAGTIFGMVVVAIRYGFETLTHVIQSNLSAPNATNSLWILQFFGTTMPILATPIIFSYFIIHEPDDYLKTSFNFPWLLIVIVLVAMIFSNPLIELLSNINEKMVLPKFLKGLEQWMKESEKSAEKISDTMMQMRTIWSMLFNLIFIGLLTAVVEEMLFRGCLQTIFIKWMRNKHIAIWITAALFSAFHMEFFGFLPRLFLGVLFGYFVAWSGSVWPSIWAHFINNGTVVVITYLSQHKMISINPDDQHVFNPIMYIISFIITIFLLFIYRYIAVKRQIADINGEELD